MNTRKPMSTRGIRSSRDVVETAIDLSKAKRGSWVTTTKAVSIRGTGWSSTGKSKRQPATNR